MTTPLALSTGNSKSKGPRVGARPSSRGWLRRGGGAADFVQVPAEFRGTSVQVCGLWPWAAGSTSPMVGVPLGRNLLTHSTVCADPISWFQRARLISNPSQFVLGQPGLGKSSLIRRQAVGLSAFGVLPMVLGDTKPDYVHMNRELGGQTIQLGPGRGRINPLDTGAALQAAARLTGKNRHEVLADAASRRATLMSALITILRTQPPTDREEAIVDRALDVLAVRTATGKAMPTVADLLQVIRDAPADVRQVAIDRGNDDRYRELTENLEASLTALVSSGRMGGIFSGQTTEPMVRDRPVCFDVSSIPESQNDLSAAALLACWSAGFGTINAANALAAADLEPQRHYFVILDELWRILEAGRGMVDRANALTRLNRNEGVGICYCTHTMSDLELTDPSDTAKARGFIERAGMVVCGGLPPAEVDKLRTVQSVSRSEEELVTSWTSPPAWDTAAGDAPPPPGRGKFLIKVGTRPGIPLQVTLTGMEASMNDTNQLWSTMSRIGGGA